MHKGNAPPAGSLAGDLVDQAIPCVPAGIQGRVQVGNTVTDVVNPGSAAGKKSPNGTVGVGRSQQFDFGVSQGETSDGGTVHHFRWMRLQAEDIAIEGQSRLQIVDGNANMGNVGAISH